MVDAPNKTPATTIPFRGHLSTDQRFHWLSNRHRNNRAAGARARHRRSIRFDRDKTRSTLRLCHMGLALLDSSRQLPAAPMWRFGLSSTAPRLSTRKLMWRKASLAIPAVHFAAECRTSAVPRSRGCDNFHASRQLANRRFGRRPADGLQSV